MTETTTGDQRRFFATCPLGVADLLAAEIKACGAARARELKSGVEFEGTLETAYRVCLWSRTASRVLMPLTQVAAHTAAALYEGMRKIDWSRHLAPTGSFVVDFGGQSKGITNTQFGAVKTKDAIVDQFREKFGERPNVDAEHPDLRINVHVHRDQGTVSIDLSGESLHRRGYRARGVAAPLKENLAAAILLRSGWPALAANGANLLDPLCGSGTLPIEAILIACDIAPGLQRTRNQVPWGFLKWRGHQARVWQDLLGEAEQRAAAGTEQCRARQWVARGYDQDGFAVRAAVENIERAGLRGLVHVERRALEALRNEFDAPGLLVTNPPYGERIGDQQNLRGLYALLGEKLRTEFVGWKAAVFTGNPPLAKELYINAKRSHTLFNGALECRLLRFDIEAAQFNTPESRPTPEQKWAEARQQPGAEMFANRLRKNFKTLSAWAGKNAVTCYRIYDADMPEYAFAIDRYASADDPGLSWVVVQEYAPPETIEREAARTRRTQVMSVLPEVLEIPRERIHVRVRRQQEGHAQYNKVDAQREFHAVLESGHRFWVNFTDYLDTGLFLDHRPTRQRIEAMARGARFLNLFAYTGSATVYAAAGGAASSTTVDMSRTYLDWAKRNLALNNLADPQHGFVQEDCRQWLAAEAHSKRRQFDLIFIDPPTFSRSKRMDEDFEVQRDHVRLLELCGELLAPQGAIIFSNNYTRFKFNYEALPQFEVEDISAATIPRDFERNKRIHCCFLLKPKRR